MGYVVFVGRLAAWAPPSIYAAANAYWTPNIAAALCLPPFFIVGFVLFSWKVDLARGRGAVRGTLARRAYNTEGARRGMITGLLTSSGASSSAVAPNPGSDASSVASSKTTTYGDDTDDDGDGTESDASTACA